MATDTFVMNGQSFSFETKPGVFAQYGLDKGSKLLLDVVCHCERQSILDLGCGCGFIGIVLAGLIPISKVLCVDSDIRAINLTKENIKKNGLANVETLISDVTSNIPTNLKFDLVVSNPPTHQGREVLVQFIQAAHDVLNRYGTAYFVVNRMSSVLHRLEEIFGNSEKIDKREGYIVFKAVRM
ncbi:MAG: methyltransferase [Patescibacteria group bacterium]